MGYHLTTSLDLPPARTPASPKTHTPLPRLQERGHRFYSPDIGRAVSRDAEEETDEFSGYLIQIAYAPSSQATMAGPQSQYHPGAEAANAYWGCFTDDGAIGPDGFFSKTGTPTKVRITVLNKACTSKCSQKHEEQHESDLGPCCSQAQSAWSKAKTKREKESIHAKWNQWLQDNAAASECRAYKVSVACADDILTGIEKTDPKAWTDADKCCSDTAGKYRTDMKGQADEYCRRAGKKPKTSCPKF